MPNPSKPHLSDQSSNAAETSPNPASVRPKGRLVIEPSEALKREVAAQKLEQQQAPTPTIPQPLAAPAEQFNPEIPPVPQLQITTPMPSVTTPMANNNQAQTLSASQMELSSSPKPKLGLFPKKSLLMLCTCLVIVAGIFAALIFTNKISFSQFKTVNYTSSDGVNYDFKFYSKHGSKKLDSGNTQLISKVSKEGKFPIAFSINKASSSAYDKLKDCRSFSKVFDVQNNNVGQKISVCSASGGSSEAVSQSIYVAAFKHNNQSHILTIAQDYSGIDLSNSSKAKEALDKFGLTPYEQDLTTIIASIKVD